MKKILYYIFLSVLLLVSVLYFLGARTSLLAKIKPIIKVKTEDALAIIYNKLHPTSDIDLVYAWVDGNDEKWQKEKEYWAKKYGLKNNTENKKSRFEENDELKYSLRSVEKYAPWVNKIYIVTNGQIPKWLNTNHPKIKIITHEQIMPKDALPTYNSMAIEANLAHIPNLSERFLYSNDDFFVNRPITPSFFFTKDGKPKYGIVRQEIKQNKKQYYKQILYSADLFKKKYNDFMYATEFMHNITPYLKSDYSGCEKEFSDEFRKVTYSKFRKDDTIQRHIISYYSHEKGNGIYIKRKKDSDKYISLHKIYDTDKVLRTYHPKLINFNDQDDTRDEDRLMLKPTMQKLWPKKSSFEK